MSWIDQRPDDAMDGAFTAVAPGPVASVEPLVFREAMSRLGAAVHVVTTAGAAGKTGFTATAVCSVSDTPAMLLVCLNRRSNSAPVLAQNGVFCVNTLRRQRREARRSVRRQKRRASGRAFFGRRMDHAQDRLAGACVRRGRVRLPHHRDQGGGVAQRASSARSRRCGSGRPVRRWSITTAPISRCKRGRERRLRSGFCQQSRTNSR